MLQYSAKNLTAAGVIFLLALLMVSCTKDVKTSQSTIGASLVSLTPTNLNSTTSTSSSNITNSFSINWDNRADGPYGYTPANQDFSNNVLFWGDQSRSQISGGKLRTTMKANLLGGDGGVISRVKVTNAAEYQLSFDMMFDPNFDFSWGGKVGFGFLIGNGYTGGVPGWDGNGGSFRVMWYKNTSTSPVILKPYVYYKDQPGTYGNDFGKAYPSNGTSIQKGVWYNIKMYAKANTGSNTDGRLTMVINGTTVIDQAIRWTTNDLNRMINNICFETFRGGAETYWQSSNDGYIYFNNVKWNSFTSTPSTTGLQP